MNILFIITSMDPKSGGPCQAIRNIVPELSGQGINTDVLSLDNPENAFSWKDSFTIKALGPALSSWCYSNKLFPWLKDNLLKYDMIIVHGLWQYPGYAVNNAVKRLKSDKVFSNIPKLFVMPHGMLDPYFQKASGRKLKALRNLIYWHLIESRLINNADAILFTCETELKLARQTFKGYKPKNELNVNFGIEKPPAYTDSMYEAFTRVCLGIENNSYILFLGRIHQKKGVDMLLRAYEIILKKFDTVPKLVISGPGIESDYGKSIRKFLDKHQILHENVIFTGMINGDEKWGVFYNCKAFILPSHQENFGIAVAEALACGKPVLISNQINISHEIKEAGAGIIGDDTLDGTVAMLSKWLNMKPEVQQQMGVNAFDTFWKYFTIPKSTQKLINSINNVG